MILSNKNIFILSPDKWGQIHISKHNYAKALAERGNRVYFFNPIDTTLPKGKIVIREADINGITHITYNPPFPLILKFKMQGFFFSLMNLMIPRFIKKIGVKPDIIWDFTVNPSFSDLNKFGAKIKILHPVDSSPAKSIRHRNAQIAFSVSKEILKTIDKTELPNFFINHGLASHFLYHKERGKEIPGKSNVQIGYVGNLQIHSLDYELFYKVIFQNPNVTFHLIGPYDGNNQLLATDQEEAKDFVRKIRTSPNVVLYGPKSSREVSDIIQTLDGFLICYKNTNFYQCDNSHKILEFLSTGKVVITNPISAYEHSELIVINKANTTEGFLATFQNVLRSLEEHNAPQLIRKRIEFAEAHSYCNLLNKIEAHLEQHIQF